MQWNLRVVIYWWIFPYGIYLVDKLLWLLQGDGQEKNYVINPRDDTVGLVTVELGAAGFCFRNDVVDGEHQLPVLQVKAHGQLGRQGRNQAFLKWNCLIKKLLKKEALFFMFCEKYNKENNSF